MTSPETAYLTLAALLLVPLAALNAAEHVATVLYPETLAAAAVTSGQGLPSAGEVLNAKIPVTSRQIDVGDDPENAYSGAPQFSSAFFGDRTQVLSKYYGLYLKYRRELGINFRYYLHEDHSFQDPLPTTKKEAILDSPVIPVIQFALLSNIDQVETDTGYFPAYEPAVIQDFLKKYPNVVFGGGNVAEYDIGFSWFYRHNYGRVPVGPGGRVFPTAFFDWNEALLKPHIPNYNSGMKLYAEIIDKMKTLGAKDLIIRVQDEGSMRNKEKYTRQRDETWNTFAALAARQGINLHLTFETTLKFSELADFSRPNVFVIEGAKGTPSPYVKHLR